MTQNDVMTIAHLAMSMTEKLYNMKEAGLVNDYNVTSFAKDVDCDTISSTIEIEVNRYAFNDEPKLTLTFDGEHPYDPAEVEAFNLNLDTIIATAMHEAQEQLTAAQAKMDSFTKFKEA